MYRKDNIPDIIDKEMVSSNNKNILNAKRNVAIDFIRVIMSIFVIYTHSVQYTNELNSVQIGGGRHFAYMALYAISQIAVPTFLMISSYFLFNSNERRGNLKSIKKVLGAIGYLVIWSILSYCVICWDVSLNVADNFLNCFFLLINSVVIGPMWYMHAYILFLLLSPVLKKIIHVLNIKEFIYLFIIYLMIVPIPNTISYIINANTEIYIAKFFPELTFVFVFFIAGGIFNKEVDKLKVHKVKYIIGIIGVCVLYWLNYSMLTKKADYNGMLHISSYYSFYNPIFSLLIFALFITIEDEVNEWFNKHIYLSKKVCSIANKTFNIYLSGTIFIHILTPHILVRFPQKEEIATISLTIFSWGGAFLFAFLSEKSRNLYKRELRKIVED